MESKIFNLNPESQLISDCIRDIKHLKTNHKYLIRLEPGIYHQHFNLPSYVEIEGSGIQMTKIIVTGNIQLDSDTEIRNLTLEFSNAKLEEDLELFTLRGEEYLENFSNIENSKNYSHLVSFKNVNLNLYNYISGSVFDIHGLNLELHEVNIHNHIQEYEEKMSLNNNILFKLGYFCEIIVKRCEIKYDTMLDNSFLFWGELAKINMQDTEIKLDSQLLLKYTYIFNLTYSHLHINNSRLENNINDGKIAFFNTNDDIITEDTISNLEIKNQQLHIRSFLPQHIYNRIIMFLKGIEYQEEVYIFGSKKELEEEIIIQLQLYGSLLEQKFKIEPSVKYYFGLDINNTILLENSQDSFYPESILEHYLTNFNQVNLQYHNYHETITCNLKNKISLNHLSGKLSIPEIDCESLANLNLASISAFKSGYSLLTKENIGNYTLDLSHGTEITDGNYSFTTGYQNKSSGNYASTFGYTNQNYGDYSMVCGSNLINNYHYSLCLGKFNISEYDINNKLLVVGNGSTDKRNDAFIVYENGNVQIDNKLKVREITVNDINIQAGNITGIENIEVDDNIFINGDLHVAGEIKGFKLNDMSQVLNLAGEIITTLKIDLSYFISPAIYGGVISYRDSFLGNILSLDEKINGLIYSIEVMCIETPNRQDLRFIVSENSNLKRGIVPEIKEGNGNLDIISSYEWTKGKRIVETDKFKFDWEYQDKEMYLYMAREVENKNYQELGDLNLTGKFLVRLKGMEVF